MDTKYTIGINTSTGEPVHLNAAQRRRHIEIVGKTGGGKSTLLANLMRADFKLGRGFAFIDPHGDLASAIADGTPPDSTNKVIYLDAADLSHSIGWNPLERGGKRSPTGRFRTDRASLCRDLETVDG